jgi:para-aminobenzoate synthetase/4-amino-4-deoxychorismate lyase
VITNKPDLELGLIETMLVLDGAVVELEAHLQRLERSTTRLYDSSLPAELRAEMRRAQRTLQFDRAARLRVSVWPSAGGLCCSAKAEPTECHVLNPLSRTGLKLRPVTVAGGLGAHKWRDRSLIERHGVGLAPGEEIVIVDADGEVLETGAGNLFAVFAKRITTPQPDHRLLPGVTRARVLELAGSLMLHTDERPLKLAELSGATEVFVTSAVRGLVPATECGESGWPVGEITQRLHSKLGELWSSSARRKTSWTPP